MTKTASPCLYLFSGLPASGKTTLARYLSMDLGVTLLRIDTIEQALRDVCNVDVVAEGYRLAYRLAADNLRLGLDVIADSCNPITTTRQEWQGVADGTQSRAINIEVVCSDQAEHRKRVESRQSDIAGLKLPGWQSILDREYHPWTENRIIIDTAGTSFTQSGERLIQAIERVQSAWIT